MIQLHDQAKLILVIEVFIVGVIKKKLAAGQLNAIEEKSVLNWQ